MRQVSPGEIPDPVQSATMLRGKAGSYASFEDFLARKVREYPSIPKYGLASPFKGHFSTKSNAFSTGSSGRLTDQYRIRDHMVAHYSKILSAKAAVDCSVPKSVTHSIKYSDQQRRERLKKDISRFEKILSLEPLSHSSSSHSSRSVSALPKKNPYEADDNMISPFVENRQLYSARSSYSSPEQYVESPTTGREVRDSLRKSVSSSMSGLNISVSSVKRISSATALSTNEGIPKDDAFLNFQDPSTKTYSGDLLEKHKHHFKDSGQPFTPRTLKTEAKSVLSQYRYYTPPRRKRREDMIEDGTQTEISFLRKPAAPLKEDATGSQREKRRTECVETSPAPETEEKLDSFQVLQHRAEWNKLSNQQYSLARFDNTKYCKPRSPVMQKVQTEEEELQYLQFVTEVTNEILTLGLFSNRVLERVFERHVEQNRNRLDENKMRHLLHVLRDDLGCNAEGPENVDSAELLSFLHQEQPKAALCHNAVPRNKCREKTARRTKILSGEQQKQMEQLLQKETGQEHNCTNSRQQCLSEGDQQELHSERVYQGTDWSLGSLSSDPGVDGLLSDMDPQSLDQCSELTQPDGDVDCQEPSLEVDHLSSLDLEDKSDATHNLEDVSDCATEPDSDLENLDESTGTEPLERYFADSLSYCKNEDGCPLDLSGGPRANPSKTSLADYESESEQFFK